MTEEAHILTLAARRIESGRRFALVTVIRATGSTPREVGARMIVDGDGSIVGSIGGAAVERLAMEEAMASLRSRRIASVEYDLNDVEHIQTGMICGGRMGVLVEPFGVGPRLHIFGAGHVAQAVARLTSELGFDITVYDARPEWASRERFPQAEIVLNAPQESAERLAPAPDDFIAIMTWCHDEDYAVLRRLLAKPFYYLGVIGSRRKAVEIREKLKGDGFAEELISRVTCPIGMPLVTHTPAEIAVSFAAQLLELRAK